MKTKINCKNCNNPFGELEKKVISIDFKRVSQIKQDLVNSSCSIKCRKCSHFSVISYKDGFNNEIDYKKTASTLLE